MEFFDSTRDTVVSFVRTHEFWSIPIVFILAFSESLAFVSLLLPFWAILVAVGAAIGTSSALFMPIWIVASIGAALGDWLSYWIGYHYRAQVASMWPLSRYPELLPRGHAFFMKYGFLAVIIGRFFGPLRAAMPIVAGSSEMNWLLFQIANWSSAFAWAFILLVFGDGIGRAVSWITTHLF